MSHHVLGTVVDLTPDPKFGPDNPGWQGGTVTFKVGPRGNVDRLGGGWKGLQRLPVRGAEVVGVLASGG